MPPRLRIQPKTILPPPISRTTGYICWQCRHASLATTPAPPLEQPAAAAPPIARYPRTKPPSYKPPEFRKSQLHRQYQSLLRSTPLMLIFQHNNLKANEWMAIRRELASALRKVDEGIGGEADVASATKINVVQTGMFASALRIVEFWNPDFDAPPSSSPVHPTDPQTASSASIDPDTRGFKSDATFTHGLSQQAYLTANSTKKRKLKHGLEPLLSGPLAILTFPTVSPQHLKAALTILAPSPDFPAPKRKANPAYHEPAVQNGLHKLLLLGARVEGKVFDFEGAKWVGGIEGGLDGLRGQLVGMLQGAGGAGVARTLEAASRSLYVTVEGRRGMLEEEEKEKQGS